MWLFWLLVLNTLTRSWNLFGYPVYTEDEGTYVSQATAILEHGDLAYYTYWYDHAPFGWMLLAVWQKLIGFWPGIESLYSVDVGRIFMVLVSTVGLWLVLSILREIQVRSWVVQATGLWLAISPLAVYYQRTIFLDNLMITLVFLGVYLLLVSQTGVQILLSAAVFGLAILTKETAIFFLPFALLLLKQKVRRVNWHFVVPLWLLVIGIIVGQYAVLAFLKGEFFPSESWLGNPGRVSLLDALLFQNNRNEYFWSETSALRNSLATSWLLLDPGVVLFGLASLLGNLYFYRRRQSLRFGLWFAGGYVFYLLKWQALEWYIIPLIPVLVVSVAVWIESLLSQQITRYVGFAVSLLVLSTGLVFGGRNFQIYTAKHTVGQQEAIRWARNNVAADEFVVIDNYAFLDLNPKEGEVANFQYHYFWKVERDPQIREGMLANQRENIDYVFVTQAMENAFEKYDFEFLEGYVEEAKVVTKFGEAYPVTVYQLSEE